jgi:hypothetical protein
MRRYVAFTPSRGRDSVPARGEGLPQGTLGPDDGALVTRGQRLKQVARGPCQPGRSFVRVRAVLPLRGSDMVGSFRG